VVVTPAAKVEAHWEDRQTLVVRPLEPLRPSTEYTVALAGALEGRARDGRFTFVNQPLEVTELGGGDPERVPPRPELSLVFNQKVVAAEVAKRCRIEDAGGAATAVVVADGAAVADKIGFGVAAPLAAGADYAVVCDGLAGAGGTA